MTYLGKRKAGTITYIKGDLFEHPYKSEIKTLIAHVCNDQGKMGSGFVVPLAKHFPKAREDYLKWSKGENDMLTILGPQGTTNMRFRRGLVQLVIVQNNPFVSVANMVAQTLGGRRPLYYNDLATCMDILTILPSMEIICPMFGSGLAGGSWGFVSQLINDCWLRSGINVTVYYLPQFLPEGFSPPEGPQLAIV